MICLSKSVIWPKVMRLECYWNNTGPNLSKLSTREFCPCRFMTFMKNMKTWRNLNRFELIELAYDANVCNVIKLFSNKQNNDYKFEVFHRKQVHNTWCNVQVDKRKMAGTRLLINYSIKRNTVICLSKWRECHSSIKMNNEPIALYSNLNQWNF